MSVSAAEQRDVVGSTTTTVDVMVPLHNEDGALPGCVRVPQRFLRRGSDETVTGMGGNYQQERHEWIEQHCDEGGSSAYGGLPEPEQPGGGRPADPDAQVAHR